MPRRPRELVEGACYHIMLRGINRQVIFYDQEDYCQYLASISHTLKNKSFELYAYCLMNNHIHLLLKPLGK